jgi:hypothetical protein
MIKSIEQVQPTSVQELIYESLYEMETYKKSQPIPLYIQTSEEKIKRIVLGILGSGGSKRAYELEEGTALLMPYGGSLSSITNSKKWSEMVDEEIMGTRRVKELGLLACDLEKTNVFMTNDSIISVPAYLTQTFSQLSLRGMWIIDQKNPRSSTWKKSFFNGRIDSFDEKNWEKLLNPFLRDIAKLLVNNFWLYADNVNLAVLEKSNQDDGVNYEIRYFGFDFSSKYGQLSFKKLSFEEISSLVPPIVGDSLSCLMSCEFGNVWNEKRRDLHKNLREKCITQIFSEIKLQTSC